MFRCPSELTLKNVFSDSIVMAVMAADGVDPHELEAALREIARRRAQPGLDRCHDRA